MTDYLISDIPVIEDAENGKHIADIILSNITFNQDITADCIAIIRDVETNETVTFSGTNVELAHSGGGGGGTVTFTNNRITNLTIEYADDPDSEDWQTLSLNANTTETVTMGVGYVWYEDSSFQPDTYTGMSYDSDQGMWVISGEASATWDAF